MANEKRIQISMNISSSTKAKLQALTELYGTQTQVVAVAVDRLWRDEMRNGKGKEGASK